MRLLLDTCTFIWAADDPGSLSSTARELITSPDNDVFFSAVSAWEIAVKEVLGNLKLSEPASQLVPRYRALQGYAPLPLDETTALQVGKLPAHHKDPFDRMLVCQAISHGLTIVTPDPKITLYPIPTLW